MPCECGHLACLCTIPCHCEENCGCKNCEGWSIFQRCVICNGLLFHWGLTQDDSTNTCSCFMNESDVVNRNGYRAVIFMTNLSPHAAPFIHRNPEVNQGVPNSISVREESVLDQGIVNSNFVSQEANFDPGNTDSNDIGEEANFNPRRCFCCDDTGVNIFLCSECFGDGAVTVEPHENRQHAGDCRDRCSHCKGVGRECVSPCLHCNREINYDIVDIVLERRISFVCLPTLYGLFFLRITKVTWCRGFLGYPDTNQTSNLHNESR